MSRCKTKMYYPITPPSDGLGSILYPINQNSVCYPDVAPTCAQNTNYKYRSSFKVLALSFCLNSLQFGWEWNPIGNFWCSNEFRYSDMQEEVQIACPVCRGTCCCKVCSAIQCRGTECKVWFLIWLNYQQIHLHLYTQ